MRVRFFAVLLCWLGYTGADAQTFIERTSWAIYASAGSNAAKLEALMSLFASYRQEGQPQQNDSVAKLALSLIERQEDNELKLRAYELYFENISEQAVQAASAEATQMMRLARKAGDPVNLAHAFVANARVHLANGNATAGLSESYNAYDAARNTMDMHLHVHTLLRKGDAENINKLQVEAYGNYLTAWQIADSIDDKELQFEVLTHLSEFFYILDDFNTAEVKNQMQLDILRSIETPDTERILKVKIEIARNEMHQGHIETANHLLQQIIDYAIVNHRRSLCQDATAVYRKMLLDNEDFATLYDFYNRKHPDEFINLKNEDHPLYLRLLAFFKEYEGDKIGARIYYDSAEAKFSGGASQRSNFYSRAAAFMLRDKDTAAALVCLRKAYSYALKADYMPFILANAGKLDTLYFLRHKFDSAYMFQALLNTHLIRWSALRSDEELTRLSVEAENKRHEIQDTKAKHLAEERVNLQYTAIALAIGISFILLLIINAVRLPRTLLRGISFTSFLFLFELLNMYIEHSLEEHEYFLDQHPLTSLALKISIAAIILPLHHLVEEKAMHYLSSHRLIRFKQASAKSFMGGLKSRLSGTPVKNGNS